MPALDVRTAPGGGAPHARPSEQERMEAAADVAARASTSLKRFARRFSLCSADAEDAYQRSLEILLLKAPTANRSELRAWLQTVIKHEALAIRRQRERILLAGEPPADEPGTLDGSTFMVDEQVGRRERARHTAEALSQLKAERVAMPAAQSPGLLLC